jgi:hypothetical protein
VGRDAYRMTNESQRLSVVVDLLVGPYCPCPAERVRHLVVEELLKMGTQINSVRVDIKGQMASW